MIWIKYNLHKDNSPIWDGVPNKAAATQKIKELRALGYNPRIDYKAN